MDKLSVMRAFCRIVERGNFARAAEDLGISPGLLSREIKLLEHGLGTSLITRTTRAMSLTDHGRLYYAEARDILAQVEGVEARIRRGAGLVSGHLRVNAPASYGQIVLSPLLPGFLAAHPELKVTLGFDDHVIDMIEGGFDLSIRIRATLPDSALLARRIGTVHQRLFAAPAYLDRAGAPRRSDELTAHRLFAYTLADTATRWQLDGPEGSVEVTFEPRARLGSSLVLRDLLLAGEGIGALPDFISDPEEARGALVRVLPDHALPDRGIYAITSSQLGSDARVTAFLDHLRVAQT